MNQPKISVDLILAKMAEDVEKAQKHILKSKEVLLGPLDTKIASTPYEIVYEEDRVKLKHYFPMAETQVKTPLLMVYALINRETMLDLQPGKSVVQNVLKEGIELYMIDWGYPTRQDRWLGIDDLLAAKRETTWNCPRGCSGFLRRVQTRAVQLRH